MKIPKQPKHPQDNRYLQWLLNNAIAIVALIMSIALPLFFRHLDKLEQEPNISMNLTYLDRLSAAKDSDLIRKIVDQSNPLEMLLRRETNPANTENLRNIFRWQDYRSFRLTIINKRNYPVSLRELKSVVYDLVYRGGKTNDFHKMTQVYNLNENSRDVQISPAINLTPNETKTIRIVIGTTLNPLFIDDDALSELNKKTEQFLSDNNNTKLKVSNTDFLMTNMNNKPVTLYFPILEEHYYSKGVLKQAQISTVDQTGRIVMSNIIQSDGALPAPSMSLGSVPLTW